MHGLLLLFLVAIVPHDGVTREQVDLVEHNHFYDEHGRLVFEQIIFYDWSDEECHYNVRAWRLVKLPGQIPQRDWTSGGWFSAWIDGEQPRYVHARHFRETWTQTDPELVEREYLAKEKRHELRQQRLPKCQSSTQSTATQATLRQPTDASGVRNAAQNQNP